LCIQRWARWRASALPAHLVGCESGRKECWCPASRQAKPSKIVPDLRREVLNVGYAVGERFPRCQELKQAISTDGREDQAIAFLSDQNLGALDLKLAWNSYGLIAAIAEQRCVAFSRDGLRKVSWHMSKHRPAWFFRQTRKPRGLRPWGF